MCCRFGPWAYGFGLVCRAFVLTGASLSSAVGISFYDVQHQPLKSILIRAHDRIHPAAAINTLEC